MSVMQVYCDKTTEWGSCSFYWKAAKCLIFQRDKFDGEIRRDPYPLDYGLKYGFSFPLVTQYFSVELDLVNGNMFTANSERDRD